MNAKNILAVVAFLPIIGFAQAIQAQADIPSIEICGRYAEADVVYEAKLKEIAPYEAAVSDARSKYEDVQKQIREELNNALVASYGILDDAKDAGGDYNEEKEIAAMKDRDREIWAASKAATNKAKALRDSTIQEAEAARKAIEEEATTILTETYVSIYADSGGMQSEVWEVMRKLLIHQRELCTAHYGL